MPVTLNPISTPGRCFNNRLQLSAGSGLVLYYFTITPQSGLPSSGSWSADALTLTETIPGSGEYFAAFPQVATALYLCPIYVQSGSTPASTDLQLGVCATDQQTPTVPPIPPNRAVTLVVDWDESRGILSVTRLGAAPGAPRPDVLPQPQNSAQTAQRILSELYKAREEIATQGGLQTVTIDGQSFTYSSISQIEQSIYFWERKVARLTGRRRRVVSLRLDRF